MQIEEGKYYRTRAGEIVGPVYANPNTGETIYVWCTDTDTYTREGRIFRALDSAGDLIKEVAAPAGSGVLVDHQIAYRIEDGRIVGRVALEPTGPSWGWALFGLGLAAGAILGVTVLTFFGG